MSRLDQSKQSPPYCAGDCLRTVTGTHSLRLRRPREHPRRKTMRRGSLTRRRHRADACEHPRRETMRRGREETISLSSPRCQHRADAHTSTRDMRRCAVAAKRLWLSHTMPTPCRRPRRHPRHMTMRRGRADDIPLIVTTPSRRCPRKTQDDASREGYREREGYLAAAHASTR